MVNKIIDDVNKKKRGMPIPDIPKPSKNGMKIGAAVNKAVGVSLIGFGLVTSKRWAIPLGITSMIANSLITNNFDDRD